MTSRRTRSVRVQRPEELRFITYLSPGIPLAFFEAVVDRARRDLGCRISLRSETRVSGPERGTGNPFSLDAADVGFMCAPSFSWLRELEPPPAELLGVAPVFWDERNGGRPVYFCDVVVRRGGPIRSFADLLGGSWAYNDRCSLSGYYGLLRKLADEGIDGRFFGRLLNAGSHLNSMDLVARGEVDAAAIDSNVLILQTRAVPELRDRLRVIESWGPYPVQPVVVRSGLHRVLKERLRASLLTMGTEGHALHEFNLDGFATVVPEDYDPERLALGVCENVTIPEPVVRSCTRPADLPFENPVVETFRDFRR